MGDGELRQLVESGECEELENGDGKHGQLMESEG